MSLLWHACPLKRVCGPDVPLLPQDLQPVYRMLLQVPLKIHQKQCVGHFLPVNHIWALQDLCRLTSTKNLFSSQRLSSSQGEVASLSGYEPCEKYFRGELWSNTHIHVMFRTFVGHTQNVPSIFWEWNSNSLIFLTYIILTLRHK